MKKILSIVLCITCLLSYFTFFGCQQSEQQSEQQCKHNFEYIYLNKNNHTIKCVLCDYEEESKHSYSNAKCIYCNNKIEDFSEIPNETYEICIGELEKAVVYPYSSELNTLFSYVELERALQSCEEAVTAYEDARNNKTVYQYNAEKGGWERVADEKAIAKAKENLDFYIILVDSAMLNHCVCVESEIYHKIILEFKNKTATKSKITELISKYIGLHTPLLESSDAYDKFPEYQTNIPLWVSTITNIIYQTTQIQINND